MLNPFLVPLLIYRYYHKTFIVRHCSVVIGFEMATAILSAQQNTKVFHHFSQVMYPSPCWSMLNTWRALIPIVCSCLFKTDLKVHCTIVCVYG